MPLRSRAQVWTQFDHTDHTKILDTDSCVCYFHILIWADFIGLSLRKTYETLRGEVARLITLSSNLIQNHF